MGTVPYLMSGCRVRYGDGSLSHEWLPRARRGGVAPTRQEGTGSRNSIRILCFPTAVGKWPEGPIGHPSQGNREQELPREEGIGIVAGWRVPVGAALRRPPKPSPSGTSNARKNVQWIFFRAFVATAVGCPIPRCAGWYGNGTTDKRKGWIENQAANSCSKATGVR